MTVRLAALAAALIVTVTLVAAALGGTGWAVTVAFPAIQAWLEAAPPAVRLLLKGSLFVIFPGLLAMAVALRAGRAPPSTRQFGPFDASGE